MNVQAVNLESEILGIILVISLKMVFEAFADEMASTSFSDGTSC